MTVSVTVSNRAPTVPFAASVGPTTAYSPDDLTCAITTAPTDPEGESLSYSYAWKRGSVLSSAVNLGVPSAELSAAQTTIGETYWCVVTATDPRGGARATTASRTIANRTPGAAFLPLVLDANGGSAVVGDTLSCSATPTDPDPEDTLLLTTFQWFAEVTPDSGTYAASTEPGNASSSLTLTAASAHRRVKCLVRITDAHGASAQVESGTVTLADTVPVLSFAAAHTGFAGGAIAGIPLSASDADGDAVEYAKVGDTCGAFAVNGAAIEGTLPGADVVHALPHLGTCAVSVVATAFGATSATKTVGIAAVNRAPALSCTNAGQVRDEGQPMATAVCTGSDPDPGTTLTLDLVAGSNGCGMTLSGNQVTGVMPAAGCTSVARVSDGLATATATLTLTLTASPSFALAWGAACSTTAAASRWRAPRPLWLRALRPPPAPSAARKVRCSRTNPG